MKLTKSQSIQALKTLSVLVCSKEFRDIAVKSIVDNTKEVVQSGIDRYPYLMKNQPSLALARCYLDTLVDSVEVTRAYELSDIGLESSRKLLNTMIETYKDQLGWTDKEFNELTAPDYTRLTLCEKIQVMLATPRQGSKYFEGEEFLKYVLKPFVNAYTEVRDTTIEVYAKGIPAFFSKSDPDYISVGNGKVVHKDLYDKYKAHITAEHTSEESDVKNNSTPVDEFQQTMDKLLADTAEFLAKDTVSSLSNPQKTKGE